MEPNQLERQVITMLLDGDDAILRMLDQQSRLGGVAKRDWSGVGFFTTFSIPPEVPRLEGAKLNFSFGDVAAEIPGLRHGAGFVLHVRDGFLHALEGYSYDEPWPTSFDHFRLNYVTKGGRNLADLRRKWV